MRGKEAGKSNTRSIEYYARLAREYGIETAESEDKLRKLAQLIRKASQAPPIPTPLQAALQRISRISYTSEIISVLESREVDAFSLAYDCLENLWVDKFQQTRAFRMFEQYREFEPLLYKDVRYRDHFIHQFYVFLTGLPIIDTNYDRIKTNIAAVAGCDSYFVNPEESWLIASSFHDIGYPLERIHSWLGNFFKDFFGLNEAPVFVDTAQLLLTRTYLQSIDKLAEFCIRDPSKTRDADFASLKLFLTRNFLQELNHGIVSALILIDRADVRLGPEMDDFRQNYAQGTLMPAASAIALHDCKVYGDNLIDKVMFENDPITFCLMYCDVLQEFGRPKEPSNLVSFEPLLTYYAVSNDKVSAILTYPIIEEITTGGSVTTNFERKEKEIEVLFHKLRSDKPLFEITIRCDDEDYIYEEFRRDSRSI